MGRWVSIYFTDEEYERLSRVLDEYRRREGSLSAYALLKRWVMERLRRAEEELGLRSPSAQNA